MNLVETYMNSQPNEIEVQNIAADSRLVMCDIHDINIYHNIIALDTI